MTGRSTFLVSAEWLSEHLDDPDLVVVDARLPSVGTVPKPDPKVLYLAGHIPGAVFFDIDAISDQRTDLPHMLPDAETFAHKMAELGISETSRIIVYDGDSLFSAPRVWWTLRIFGISEVFVLDGGLKAWRDARYTIETGERCRASSTFKVRFSNEAIKSFEQTLAALQNRSAQVLDARSAERFAGHAPEPRPGLRGGHMPGSINIPFATLLEEGRLKSPEALQKLFEEKHVDIRRPIITSCGSGVTAAVLALGLETIGAKAVSIYDGSWSEWGGRTDAPVETLNQ